MKRGVVGLAALSALVLAAAAATAGYFLRPMSPPERLESAPAVTRVPTVAQKFDDSRKVQVRLEKGADTRLLLNTAGVITATHCTKGGTIVSGSIVARVNESPILALSTAVPLYRDLTWGTKGTDVNALQRELVRLGFTTPVDGTFGRTTAKALSALWKSRGVDHEYGGITLAELVWMPGVELTVSSCDATLGVPVSPGGSLATVPGVLQRVVLDSAPADLVAGPRTLTVVDIAGPLSEHMDITDADTLAKIASNTLAQATLAVTPGETLPARIALTSPLTTIKVPLGTLFHVNGNTGCVQSGSDVFPVTIVSSSLGATLLTFDRPEHVPTEVNLGSAITRTECGQQ